MTIARWTTKMDVAAIVAVLALSVSGLSFYRSYIYTHQQLDVTVRPDIPLAVPKMPMIVKAGGVEVVSLSAMLNPADAEQAQVSSRAFVGIRVATMNSDGNLF